MAIKLTKPELGYALAILDTIGLNLSIEKKELAGKFPAKIITWLADNNLIMFKTLSFESGPLEIRVGLGEKARELSSVDKDITRRIAILDSINNTLR